MESDSIIRVFALTRSELLRTRQELEDLIERVRKLEEKVFA